MPFETREEYLYAAVDKLRPVFESKQFTIPAIQVACGFGAKNPKRTMGECWHSTATENGVKQIFISPAHHSNAVEVLGTLAHELLHAVLPDGAKHGKLFKDGMKKIGLEGKAIHAAPGDELNRFIEKVVGELGEFPNSRIILKEKERKNKKNTFKLHCPEKRVESPNCVLSGTFEGDYEVKATVKSLTAGFPKCPCGAEMRMTPEDFEEYKAIVE
jgi:hypothetical protein